MANLIKKQVVKAGKYEACITVRHADFDVSFNVSDDFFAKDSGNFSINDISVYVFDRRNHYSVSPRLSNEIKTIIEANEQVSAEIFKNWEIQINKDMLEDQSRNLHESREFYKHHAAF